jgi:hypothetical protein
MLVEHRDKLKGDNRAAVSYLLLQLYVSEDRLDEALELAIELKEANYFSCDDLRKMKRYFGKMELYTEYMKTCKDE